MGYKVLDLTINLLSVSHNVVFHKSIFPFATSPPPVSPTPLEPNDEALSSTIPSQLNSHSDSPFLLHLSHPFLLPLSLILHHRSLVSALQLDKEPHQNGTMIM